LRELCSEGRNKKLGQKSAPGAAEASSPLTTPACGIGFFAKDPYVKTSTTGRGAPPHPIGHPGTVTFAKIHTHYTTLWALGQDAQRPEALIKSPHEPLDPTSPPENSEGPFRRRNSPLLSGFFAGVPHRCLTPGVSFCASSQTPLRADPFLCPAYLPAFLPPCAPSFPRSSPEARA